MPERNLYIGARFTGVAVVPDGQWPNMWRVGQGDRLSDMVNLTRAKDAAVAWARPKGLGGKEKVRWSRRQTGAEAGTAAQLQQGLPDTSINGKRTTAPLMGSPLLGGLYLNPSQECSDVHIG